MPVFIPRKMQRASQTTLSCYCQWCAARGVRKRFFKMRDGPVDWFFCNEEHALDWLEYRHRAASINAMLKLPPKERAEILK